ncbi:hypothetical protein [Phormidesmis sp. 146-33]
MSQFPDDHDLVKFLRQHRPVSPPASEDLEDALMSALPEMAPAQRPRYLWVVPSAIAATLVASFLSYRAFLPPQPSPTELASLEDFMETNWHNTVNDSDTQFLPVSDEQ